jgi:hypothetical protein
MEALQIQLILTMTRRRTTELLRYIASLLSPYGFLKRPLREPNQFSFQRPRAIMPCLGQAQLGGALMAPVGHKSV